MYSVKEYKKLPHELILEKTTDWDIFQAYFPFKPGHVYNSPLRNDKNPSFGFYKYGEWKFKDLGTGETGNCFDFVQRLLNLNYFDSCRDISTRLNLRLFKPLLVNYKVNPLKTNKVSKIASKSIIDVVEKEFTEKELNYWSSYNISKEILDLYLVTSCKKVFVNNTLWRYSTEENPIFCYNNPLTGNKKIYRPFAKYKTEKWRTNENNEKGIFGYIQLPKKGELVILEESAKDVMCLYSLGYNSVASNAAGYGINPDFFRHLKGRFNRVVVMFDLDEKGYINSQKLCRCNELDCIYTEKEKNISDYLLKYGVEASIKLMKELLK